MKSRSTSLLSSFVMACLSVGCAGGTATVRPATVTSPPVTASSDSAPVQAPVAERAAPPSAAPAAAPWQSVENPAARYIAVLGLPTAHDDSVSEDHLAQARRIAAQTLQSFDDIELAPAHFDRSKLLEESTRRKLLGVAFECGVVEHDVDARGTHFTVNVTVVDLRTEDIVATLAGRATAPGPTGPDAEQNALEGALQGAMRGVPKLLASLENVLVAER